MPNFTNEYINTIYQFIKPFLDNKCLILRNMEPSVTTILVFLSYLADNKMNILYKCAGTCFITMASTMIIR